VRVECTAMSTRASGGAAAGTLITAAIIGLGGGAIAGSAGGGDPGAGPGGTSPPASSSPSESAAPASGITLSSTQTSVAPGDRIEFTGRLEPAAAGITFTVERKIDDGAFETFPGGDKPPITVETGEDGSFSTYVQSSREGQTQWRVVGQVGEDFLESEPVAVTIG